MGKVVLVRYGCCFRISSQPYQLVASLYSTRCCCCRRCWWRRPGRRVAGRVGACVDSIRFVVRLRGRRQWPLWATMTSPSTATMSELYPPDTVTDIRYLFILFLPLRWRGQRSEQKRQQKYVEITWTTTAAAAASATESLNKTISRRAATATAQWANVEGASNCESRNSVVLWNRWTTKDWQDKDPRVLYCHP